MHVTNLKFKNFRRFTDLEIANIDPTTRLVVLAGPNGTGKSSVFDGLRIWQGNRTGSVFDDMYHTKAPSAAQVKLSHDVDISFDRQINDPDEFKRSIYVRTAYRNESEFQLNGFGPQPRIVDMHRPGKMIEQESTVSQNYQQLLGQTINGVFDRSKGTITVDELREGLIGEVRESMKRVFGDLLLEGFFDPLAGGGTFYFEKGNASHWPYKNLSGGEKATFDILLDIIVKRSAYDDTVYCIDEPETHLNTRIQGKLLIEMLNLLPGSCQLWIASHSIGMLSEAWKMYESGTKVAFLDFENFDFDKKVVLSPITPDRKFWQDMLSQTMGDLASLVAPQTVVLVEGRARTGAGDKGNVEFDAACLRKIFGDTKPTTGFVSAGNASEVVTDFLKLGEGLQMLVPGATVIRLIDRDDRSNQEVDEIRKDSGKRVLDRRDLENYLLDDEILSKLCKESGHEDLNGEVLKEKERLIAEGSGSGRSNDDIKMIAGDLYVYLKGKLGLSHPGNTKHAFMRDTLANLITSDTSVYKALDTAIFG